MSTRNTAALDTVRSGHAGKVVLALVMVVLVVIAMLMFVRPYAASTGPDQVYLHYKGGAFSSKRFSDCIEPSNRVGSTARATRTSPTRPRRPTSCSTPTPPATACRSPSSPATASR